MDKTKNHLIRTGGSLTWEEREEMIKEYQSGKYTKAELWEKYTGQQEEHGQLLQWMRKLGYLTDENRRRVYRDQFPRQQFPDYLNKKEKQNDSGDQAARIRELERKLAAAELKAEGLDLMIDLAEKEYKIRIRKKSATK